MNPKVSVIIANYNSEKYIEEAIRSILDQTFKDFELIVVDDKSTDNSISIISELAQKDNRIKLIALEHNSGVTYSRQFGLQNASGEYIAILDSDDIAHKTRIEEQVECLNNNPDVVLVASDYGVIDENGRVKKKQKKVQKNEAAIKWYLTFGNCFAHSTIMFRSATAKELGGYDLNIKRGLDMELSSKLLTKGKIVALPKSLSYWRTYPKSMTKSVSRKELDTNYILSVQNSVLLHLNKKIDFGTASAVFYNYKNSAENSENFSAALDLIKTAFIDYSKLYPQKDYVYLERAALKHLLKICERNINESWWSSKEKKWAKTFLSTIGKKNLYNLIIKNISRLSARNIKTLLTYKSKRLI
jgi:glycosyltransferase involved in cell wall biosynthesis